MYRLAQPPAQALTGTGAWNEIVGWQNSGQPTHLYHGAYGGHRERAGQPNFGGYGGPQWAPRYGGSWGFPGIPYQSSAYTYGGVPWGGYTNVYSNGPWGFGDFSGGPDGPWGGYGQAGPPTAPLPPPPATPPAAPTQTGGWWGGGGWGGPGWAGPWWGGPQAVFGGPGPGFFNSPPDPWPYTIPPRNLLVDRPGPTGADRVILPMSSGVNILPNTSAQITSRPQNYAFRPERCIISGAADWVINDIKVGNMSQFSQSGDVPGEMFGATTIDGFVKFTTCQTAMDFVIVTTFVGASESGAPFVCGVLGTAAVN